MSGYELSGKKVYVAGHGGMVGSALVRRLARENCETVTAPRSLDLREQAAVRDWFARERPDAVFVAAARVGGIAANAARPVGFMYDNLMIGANIVEAAARSDVGKLVFLGSSCVYPREAAQPIAEDALLTGPLEPTNQWYAIAKIAIIKLVEAFAREEGRDFISIMPCNLYGPGDNFDLETSHVLPALIRKAHEAKLAGDEVLEVWGSGRPLREFLHVDDCADGLVTACRRMHAPALANLGSGDEISIADLARLVASQVGFEGRLIFDASRPDGTPRKLMDASAMQALGWSPSIPLDRGIADAYRWFLNHVA